MSKLNVDQKNIRLLLSDKKADFLIPDYQRPYAGRKKNVKIYGKIFLRLQFQMMMQQNSIVKKNII